MNFFRPPADLLRMLIPLFKLDTKAQRGFMACISLENLELVMKEETILLEIKLATLLHYFENVKSEKEVGTIYFCCECCFLEQVCWRLQIFKVIEVVFDSFTSSVLYMYDTISRYFSISSHFIRCLCNGFYVL